MKHLIQIADEFENVRGIYIWDIKSDSDTWREGSGIYDYDEATDTFTPKPAVAALQEMNAYAHENPCDLT